MEDYFEAKASLFADPLLLADGARSVVNSDDPWGARLAERLGAACWRSSLEDPSAELHMSDLQMTAAGVEGRLISPLGEGRFRSPLLGRFNLMNLLQAVGVLLQQQLPLPVLLEAIGRFGGVPGRMERVILNGVDAANLPPVLVDYAHTPDGLDNALSAARPFCVGRLICVFGCGGDRDRGKRPQMAAIAARLADRVVVTSDNPRTEDPQQILDDVVAGFRPVAICWWRVIEPRRLLQPLPKLSRTIWCWWLARGTRITRFSAPKKCTSTIARKRNAPCA